MKTSLSASNRRAGYALLLTLILAGISILLLSAAMYRNSSIATMNQRNNVYNTCCNAAEAAVEQVFSRMAFDFQTYGVAGVSNNLSIYRNAVPTAAQDAFWSQFVFTDAQGNTAKTYVTQAYTYGGYLPSAYTGLFTTNAPVYRIISNAYMTNSSYSDVVGTAQEDVLLALVPLTTWAIFYNGLLEFTQCATMTVNGRVQANGAIYVGTTAGLTFYSGVSCTATLSAPFVDGLTSGWTPGTPSTWGTTFTANPGYTTNVPSVTVSLNMTNSHFMIDVPPTGESPTSTTGKQRLYNQAQMIVIVTNSPASTNPAVQVTLQNSFNGVPGNDPAPTVLYYTNATPGLLSSNLPFLSLTNSTYDQREQDTNIITQIDVGRFSTWAATNADVQGKLPAVNSIYPTILFVADRRNANAKQLPSVRLMNGAQLPANNNMGFTVATPNPLYVWGNYNVTIAGVGGTPAASTTNTTSTVPAALFSDSLTVLSPNWTDSDGLTTYNNTLSSFSAADMTINAAIITGTVPSTGTAGTNFSGGVHNLPRLLENWTGKNLWLNTSILRLWDSQMATNQFRNPQGFSPAPVNPYYNPPTRHYAFDLNFLNPAKVPPGIPVALVPIRFGWGVPPPNNTTFTPTHN